MNTAPARRFLLGWPDYRTVWRWHFYAGLFCIPFVLWLACTGAIYLFKPQVEAWLDRPYDHLQIDGPLAAPQAQVAAALAAVPGGRLNAYQLPPAPGAAVRILVGRGTVLMRVYVHPQTCAVLQVIDEDARLMPIISRLHGELMLGDRGSNLVELAASWAIVMLLTGLYLWWPRNAVGAAGVLYPRLHRGGRVFWRDLHGVTGFWISFFALFLLFSGLPWTKSWGSLLRSAHGAMTALAAPQDWTTGRSDALARRRAENAPPPAHHGHAAMAQGDDMPAPDYTALDRLVEPAAALALAPPVLIAPPSRSTPTWTARSESQNRTERVRIELDAASGEVLRRRGWADSDLFDRVIGVGISAHEGQLFGWFNQALGVFTALGLILISSSALVLWWRRRPPDRLGAPLPSAHAAKLSWVLFAVIAVIGLALPMFGLTLLAVLAGESLLQRIGIDLQKLL